MIERNFIHVYGQPGAGKTLLIERLLRSNRSLDLSVLRTETVQGLVEPRESGPGHDEELQRLLVAGASATARLRCPEAEPVDEVLWDTDLLADYSQGVLIEGPLGEAFPAYLRVFVSGPPARDQHLVAEQSPVQQIQDIARILEVGDTGSLREAILASQGSVPPAFAGAMAAELFLVNVRDAAERPRATRLAKEFEALPESLVGSRRRRAWVADFADRRDPGLRPAITTIKRALRART